MDGITPSDWTAWLVAGCSLAAALGVMAYFLSYLRHAWWASSMGRALMASAVTAGVAAVLSSLAWTTIAASAGGLGAIRIALAISWLALGFAKLGLMREVIRAQAYRTDSKEKE